MTPVNIIGISSRLGSDKTSIDELITKLQFIKNTKKLKNQCGNEFIYRFSSDESLLSRSIEASLDAIKNAGISNKDITAIYATNSSPTFANFIPGYARVIGKEIGLTNIPMKTVSLGCTSGLDAIFFSYNHLRSIDEKGFHLILSGDATRKSIDDNDKSTSLLFSEGVIAAITTNENVSKGLEIEKIVTTSFDGDIYAMEIKNSGDRFFRMNGEKVYEFVINKVVPEMIKTFGDNLKDNSYLITHQPSLVMLNQIQSRLNLPPERFYNQGIKKFGNLVGASVLFGLEDAIKNDYIDNYQKIILSAFGAELALTMSRISSKGNYKSVVGKNIA